MSQYTPESADAVRRGRIYSWSVFCAAVIVFIAAYLLGVQSAAGQRAENSLLGASEFLSDVPAPLGWVSIASILGSGVVIAILALLRGSWRAAVQVGLGIGATILSSQLLKNWLLERPDFHAVNQSNSFPSGHASVVAALVFGLLIVVPATARWILAIPGVILLSVVSWQLLAFGWHRPSDVIGGIALACGFLALGCALRPGGSPRAAGPGVHALRRVRLALGMLGLIGAILAAVIALVGVRIIESVGEPLLLSGEVAGVAGALVATAIVCGLPVRRAQARRNTRGAPGQLR
ncbi:phosphatase PAP2 family protein [Mycetocola spongiae]|uniref:phosphatase PAP2 family protein n=1 Tax=Mycetocola spongiae TaxID=2859226 RepID=UPI001CF128CB|nr:phosphatase PAP2 family protein [Mycetocola spongiae]UCR89884.1 phosphatase PAP2 family protein [Mycetocola spongiae]